MPYTIVRLNSKTYTVVNKDSGKTAYLINKSAKDCFSVINTETGKVHAKCTSLQNAKAQLRLLYGIESGQWKPAGKKPAPKKKGGMMVLTEEVNDEGTGDDEEGSGLYVAPQQSMRRRAKGGQMELPPVPEPPSSPPEVPSPPPQKETWKTFFTKHAQGRKFANQADTHEFMRKVGALWKAHKAQKQSAKKMESEAKKMLKQKTKGKK